MAPLLQLMKIFPLRTLFTIVRDDAATTTTAAATDNGKLRAAAYVPKNIQLILTGSERP